MIAGKTILAIIPARGGSKGVPRKNIRLLAGKPLIAWTIEEAKKSKYIDRLILSSEDDEIVQTAKDFGCEVPFIRPAELALDNTPGIEPVIHAIDTITEKYDYVLLLQPTSPLRKVEDIDLCIEKCIESAVPACVSICEVDHSPYWMFVKDEQKRLKPIIKMEGQFSRRQELPPVYRLNGAIYIALCDYVRDKRSFLSDKTIGYEMSVNNSLDIDTEYDFKLAEVIMTKQL